MLHSSFLLGSETFRNPSLNGTEWTTMVLETEAIQHEIYMVPGKLNCTSIYPLISIDKDKDKGTAKDP